MKTLRIDSAWTLMLDRDGVINRRVPGGYVKHWEDFHFLPGVLRVLPILAGLFPRILIITNQQGIGKELMTEEDLHAVHEKMQEAIRDQGGRIDGIFFCPDLESDEPNCRKPNPVLGEQAKEQFPEILFSKTIMVGDSISDMQFGKKLGAKTVLIKGKQEEAGEVSEKREMGTLTVDLVLESLEYLPLHLKPASQK